MQFITFTAQTSIKGDGGCSYVAAADLSMYHFACAGRPSIIILDRGCLDAKGYMDSTLWKRVLDNVDSTDTDTGQVKTGVTETCVSQSCFEPVRQLLCVCT